MIPSTVEAFIDSKALFTELKSINAIGKRVFTHFPIESVLFLERNVSILSGPAPLALMFEGLDVSLNFSLRFRSIKVVDAPVSTRNTPFTPLIFEIILK